jgi:hypothetical protein
MINLCELPRQFKVYLDLGAGHRVKDWAKVGKIGLIWAKNWSILAQIGLAFAKVDKYGQKWTKNMPESE